MQLISLSSTAPNFRTYESNLIWEFDNLIFDGATKVALSSICLSHKTSSFTQNFPISTSIIDADIFNSEGIIAVGKFTRQNFNYQSPHLEFWEIDCQTPRDLLFTLHGIKAADISFANIVLVVK